MDKSGKNIGKEILKCIIYAVLGAAEGVILASPLGTAVKIAGAVGILCLLALSAVLFILLSPKNTAVPQRRTSLPEQNGRISRSTSYQENKNDTGFASDNRQQTNRAVSSQVQSAQVQSNPLDRRPMSAEKKEQRNRNRVPASKIVLINEEGTALMEWSLQRHTSLIIGKSSEKEPVDIDLSGSAVAQMISKQHAVLNYTENGWYIDDIDSKNGTRVKKASQNAIMDVLLTGAVEVEPGDIIYIASTMLQIQ